MHFLKESNVIFLFLYCAVDMFIPETHLFMLMCYPFKECVLNVALLNFELILFMQVKLCLHCWETLGQVLILLIFKYNHISLLAYYHFYKSELFLFICIHQYRLGFHQC